MHLDTWLRQVYEEDVLTKEASNLEALFDQMSHSDLLDIACGRTTIEKVAAKGFLTKHKDKIVGALATAPLAATTGYLAGTAKGYKEGEKKVATKTASAKLAFVDQMARELARTHYQVKLAQDAEEAKAKAKEEEAEAAEEAAEEKEEAKGNGMVKEDEFTTPEAQAKAKVMQKSMQLAKGAPPTVRKGMVQVAAKEMKKAGSVKIAVGDTPKGQKVLRALGEALSKKKQDVASAGLSGSMPAREAIGKGAELSKRLARVMGRIK